MLFLSATSKLKPCLISVGRIIPKSFPNNLLRRRKMSTNIVWVDMEMTGLDIKKDKVLEISCLITDSNLNLITEGKSLVLKRSREILDNMNDWCIEHHNKSGLVQKCLESNVTVEQAEDILLEYLKKHIPERKCPLAGNSVYMDRLFLRMEFPRVDEYLHYRIIDVSSIKELARRWAPAVCYAAPQKKLAHRSLDDIEDSIEELKYYRANFFKLET